MMSDEYLQILPLETPVSGNLYCVPGSFQVEEQPRVTCSDVMHLHQLRSGYQLSGICSCSHVICLCDSERS